MNLWEKMQKAKERVGIKRELRRRNISFDINESTESLKLKLEERKNESNDI